MCFFDLPAEIRNMVYEFYFEDLAHRVRAAKLCRRARAGEERRQLDANTRVDEHEGLENEEDEDEED